ncbi:hypothetical protein [Flavobacterium terrisoli]|uniref:hypothetical protein n=1 Tax=Flavobacterium terrisoli TaxID=3242195 RepID=UPI0025439A0C|nr:hypothetical protein [Flavobacterium buctense]
MKKTISTLSIFCALISLFSCSSDDGGSNSNNNNTGWENPGSSAFGKFVEIPGIDSQAGTGAALDLKTSNEGLYMHVSKYTDNTDWIYRLQQGGASPSWIFHEQPELYFHWAPGRPVSENENFFEIFFHTLYTNGWVSINTGLPALLEEDNPPGSGSSIMLVDNSTGAYKWLFEGSTVKIQQNNDTGIFDVICTLPTVGGVSLAEADPFDSIVWAAAGNILYKITASGQVTSFNVASFNDPNFPLNSIEKIRFSYDPSHKDVYFRCQNKIFKVADGNTLSLFNTIEDANFLGGDFCLDNSYLYTSNGTKKHLFSSSVTNIIPDPPTTTNQQVLLDYYSQVSAFQSGQIETSKDPSNPNLYILSSDKILVVPKSRN